MNKNVPISIIMPCLNSAKYIEEALDSVLGQSFTDFELIIVDGGSTDGTLDILSDRASDDDRVRVLRSSKKSMGAQYNIGLDAAQGEFIGFVESDDYIAPNMCEILYNAIKKNDVDYVKSDFDIFIDLPDHRIFYTCGPIAENQSGYYNRVLSPVYLCELMRRDIFIWNGLYRRSFIKDNDIRFQETPGAAFQDAGFASQALMCAKSALYLKDSFYRYRKGNQGASSSSIRTHEFVMDEFMYVIEKVDPQAKDLFLPALLRRFFGFFHNFLRQNLRHCWNTGKLTERVKPFRKLFLDCYNSLSFSGLSRSDLWPPQDLALFASDFEEYCKVIHTRYISDCSAQLQAAEYLAGQATLVICGVGENTASVYCYLTRCGLRNIAAFCSDKPEGDYYGKAVLSTEQVTQTYPGATFLITQSAGNQDKLKHQLMGLGIAAEQIIYYGAGLFHHNWYELPVTMEKIIQSSE